MRLRICHLYPELLNLYGDRGNLLVLQRRAEWRGIAVEINRISLGDTLAPDKYDLFFLGGGSDEDQGIVARDLLIKGPYLQEALARGAALLAICGGYQLLGRYYQTRTNEVFEGVGLFPVFTIAGDKRLKGNIAIEVEVLSTPLPVVGFENHIGKTYPERPREGFRPLGRILFGYGNNGEDGTEGCVYGRAIGTYLHGPLLAKNPHLADYILTLALEARYGKVELRPLPGDEIEWKAHEAFLRRFSKERRR
ncbi:MAG: glutamine amidotransferase [Thermanaeromonas sp.]|uniref:type 1 glutamine amidotransferase n=1 Tax=Thermanaeromonas sp. TaxID=2003697 RepID=UPI0024387631|nr:glutamine amidotransferase [Thermanaeromonas sp.]MCG0277231.1 glutamine amidotransferase [Thermanaeromonas sp.]